jgi:hypothetical protein
VTAGARIGAAIFATFIGLTGGGATTRITGFAAGRLLCDIRADLPDLALTGLPALARDAAVLALRAAGLATRVTLRAAGALRDATFLVAGFLVFEAFFAGISFSAPG